MWKLRKMCAAKRRVSRGRGLNGRQEKKIPNSTHTDSLYRTLMQLHPSDFVIIFDFARVCWQNEWSFFFRQAIYCCVLKLMQYLSPVIFCLSVVVRV